MFIHLLAPAVGWCALGSVGQSLGSAAKSRLTSRYQPIAPDGVLPPALHLREGVVVRVVSVDGGGSEVAVLLLDHLIGGDASKREVTRPAQLTAGHRLHDRCSIRFGWVAGISTRP